MNVDNELKLAIEICLAEHDTWVSLRALTDEVRLLFPLATTIWVHRVAVELGVVILYDPVDGMLLKGASK